MIALLVGTGLAVAALAFVLYPIFARELAPPEKRVPRAAPRVSAPPAIEALREIEFDRATGKLADQDYQEMRDAYTREALAALRAADASARSADDAAEEAVRRIRSRTMTCPVCGPRSEPDPLYCSTCGRYLAGRCPRCEADVAEAGARFCGSCGSALG